MRELSRLSSASTVAAFLFLTSSCASTPDYSVGHLQIKIENVATCSAVRREIDNLYLEFDEAPKRFLDLADREAALPFRHGSHVRTEISQALKTMEILFAKTAKAKETLETNGCSDS